MLHVDRDYYSGSELHEAVCFQATCADPGIFVKGPGSSYSKKLYHSFLRTNLCAEGQDFISKKIMLFEGFGGGQTL